MFTTAWDSAAMLNVLPWRKEQLIRRKKILLFALVTLCVCTSVCVISIRFYIEFKTTQRLREINHLNESLKKRVIDNQVMSRHLQKNIDSLHNQARRHYQQKIIVLLHNLIRILPENCYLKAIQYDQTGFQFEGILLSSSQEALERFFYQFQQKNKINIKDKKIECVSNKKIAFKFGIEFLKENDK
jgi:Tfp pilus assembly protein PilN